jgi:hypothetical protein
MRPFVTRASSVRRIVETVPSGSMIESVSGDEQSMTDSSGERNLQCRELINELERQPSSGRERATFGSGPLVGASLTAMVKYNTTLGAGSQCLFFRREDDARTQASGLGLVNNDREQIPLLVNHADGLAVRVLPFSRAGRSHSDAVAHSPRFLTR